MPRLGTRADGRAVLLDSAIANFTLRGYHGTSMRDIAADAQVAVATIYHHFGSKQEILQEIMTATMRDTIGLTRAALVAAGGSPSSQLHDIVRAWILFHTERQPEALIGASELRSLDDTGRRFVVTLRDEQEAIFREVIDRGAALGDFTTPYPREAARAVINMGYAVATWFRPDGSITPEGLAERYCVLSLATVGGRPAQ